MLTYLLKAKDHQLVRNSLPMDPIQSQMNPVHTLTAYVFKIHFNTILSSAFRSPKRSLHFVVSG